VQDPTRRPTPLPSARDDARLRRIVDEMPVGVLVADLVAGTFVVANARAVETFGPTVAAGSAISAFAALAIEHLDGRPCPPASLPLLRALAGQPVKELEVRVLSPGGERLARLGASALIGREGRPVGAVATCQDIGGELAARAERARMERFRETFLGVVGHDLRFPLSVIALTASTLLREEREDARRGALNRIARSAGRMERMIAQLLDLTRLRVGQGIEFTPAPADLGALAATVVEQAREAAPGVDLRLEVAGDCALAGDPDRLEQVLDNLVGNAVQHGAATAPVEVKVDGTGAARVRLTVRNGGSVPPHVLGSLFEPFRSRGGQRATRAGLGLGLYISRQLVEAHGGGLEVRSSPDEGTCFTVALPRRLEARVPEPGA
jgi:signal transduction histidine kinase